MRDRENRKEEVCPGNRGQIIQDLIGRDLGDSPEKKQGFLCPVPLKHISLIFQTLSPESKECVLSL